MATWTVVKFLSDNSIEAVPTNWLDGKKCYWPHFEAIKMTKTIRNCDPALPNWEMYEVDTFRNATYDNYMTARKKCQKAEHTSDLNSDGDTPRRRRPPLKLQSDPSSSDSDHSEIKSSSKKLPQCPRFNLSQGILTFDNEIEHSTNPKHKEIEESPILVETCDFSDKRESEQVLGAKTDENQERKRSYLVANDVIHQKGSCRCEDSHKRIEEYCKQILRKMTMMEIMMTDLKSQVSLVAAPQPLPEECGNIWEHISLPLNIESSLDEFEHFLKEEGNFTKSVDELSKVGGATLDEFIKRSLKKLMTNTLQKQFSWLGKKNKKNFSNLELAKLIKYAAWKNRNSKTSSEKEIEESVQKYIRRAREREEAELKKNTK